MGRIGIGSKSNKKNIGISRNCAAENSGTIGSGATNIRRNCVKLARQIEAGCGAGVSGNGGSLDNLSEISKETTSREPVNAATPRHPAAAQKNPPQYPTMLDPK